MSSTDQVIDLRSDTVTRPDSAMKQSMVSAPLGDDVFRDDPTVQALEAKAAEITGKEAALFVPSGTMANTIAIGLLAHPGDEVVLNTQCHSFNFECGGASRLWGVQTRPLRGERGQIPLEDLEGAIRPADIHMPRTRLVILEQTSNIAGGCVLPLEYMSSVSVLCRRRDLLFHIDGARIFNASVASGIPVSEYASLCDTLMFCVSKGLGAPAGSLLTSSRERIEEARRLRKLLGGGMRQAGVLAACGLYALENNVSRLADDHRHAREVAEDLEPLRRLGLEVAPPETNMLFLRWPGSSPARYSECVATLENKGIRALGADPMGIRLVFHKDVGDAAVTRIREVLPEVLKKALSGPSRPRFFSENGS